MPSLLDCKLADIDAFGLVPLRTLSLEHGLDADLGEADLRAQLRTTWRALRYHFRRAQSELSSPPPALPSDALPAGGGVPDSSAPGSRSPPPPPLPLRKTAMATEDLFPSLTLEAQEAAWTQPKRTTPRSTARSLYAAFEEASTFPDESDFRALDRLDTMAEEGLTTPRDLRDGYSPSLGALNSDDDSYLASPAASDYDDASMGSAPPLHPRSRVPKRTMAERSPQQATHPRGERRHRSGATPLRVRLLPDGPSGVRLAISARSADGKDSPPPPGENSPINLLSAPRGDPSTTAPPPARAPAPALAGPSDPPLGDPSPTQCENPVVRTLRPGHSNVADPALDDIPAEYDGSRLSPQQCTLLRNLPIHPSSEELAKLSVAALRALLFANGVGSAEGRAKPFYIAAVERLSVPHGTPFRLPARLGPRPPLPSWPRRTDDAATLAEAAMETGTAPTARHGAHVDDDGVPLGDARGSRRHGSASLSSARGGPSMATDGASRGAVPVALAGHGAASGGNDAEARGDGAVPNGDEDLQARGVPSVPPKQSARAPGSAAPKLRGRTIAVLEALPRRPDEPALRAVKYEGLQALLKTNGISRRSGWGVAEFVTAVLAWLREHPASELRLPQGLTRRAAPPAPRESAPAGPLPGAPASTADLPPRPSPPPPPVPSPPHPSAHSNAASPPGVQHAADMLQRSASAILATLDAVAELVGRARATGTLDPGALLAMAPQLQSSRSTLQGVVAGFAAADLCASLAAVRASPPPDRHRSYADAARRGAGESSGGNPQTSQRPVTRPPAASSQQPATSSQQLGSCTLPGAPPPGCRPEDCPHPLHSLCHDPRSRPPSTTPGSGRPDGGIGPPHSARRLPSSIFCGISSRCQGPSSSREHQPTQFWEMETRSDFCYSGFNFLGGGGGALNH